MSATESNRTPGKPRLVHFLMYGTVAGLIAVGGGAVFSAAVYGSSDPSRHGLSMIILGALVVFAGLSADRVIIWLLARPKASGAVLRKQEPQSLTPFALTHDSDTSSAQNGAGGSQSYAEICKGENPCKRAESRHDAHNYHR
jgi:hypothetical protein